MQTVRSSRTKGGPSPAASEVLHTRIQRKLSIGASNDIYEKEADAMADKVIDMKIPEPVKFSSAKNNINRKCSHCEEEEEQLQRKESNSDPISEAPSIVQNVLSSSYGKSMDDDTRSFMESRFNYDFSDVKIHDGELAAKSADSINALAYTSGNNIVFNSQQYNPDSDPGKKLLAHELTHVIQQTDLQRSPGNNQTIQRQSVTRFTPTSPRFAGDPLLERVFNDEAVISKNRNRSGEPVRKIQQALIDAGFPLPQFGADAKFGDETERAVKAFQNASGLNQAEQDGIVGENTLSRLDSRFPTANAPGSPPVCETPKKVPVDVIILDGVQRNVQQDFNFMNQVYGSCCLQFVQNSSTQLGPVETFGILGFDGLLDVANCGDITLNEGALALSMGLRGLSGRVRLVYVNTLNPSSRGLSVSPKCGTGLRSPLADTVMIEAASDSRTPAHEIGHVLLNVFADHAVVTSNIMHVTPGSTGNDAARVQCDILFART
jgi:hypothetical protein